MSLRLNLIVGFLVLVCLYLLITLSQIHSNTEDILQQLSKNPSLSSSSSSLSSSSPANSFSPESQKYLSRFPAHTRVLGLQELIALANMQCESVRSGALDLDSTGQLIEVRRGKLAAFKTPLRLPVIEEVQARNKVKQSGLMSPLDESPRFKDFEFGCFSQNSEDGILLAIFWAIGVQSGRVVEICSGVGWENNAATLALHFGFDGKLGSFSFIFFHFHSFSDLSFFL